MVMNDEMISLINLLDAEEQVAISIKIEQTSARIEQESNSRAVKRTDETLFIAIESSVSNLIKSLKYLKVSGSDF